MDFMSLTSASGCRLVRHAFLLWILRLRTPCRGDRATAVISIYEECLNICALQRARIRVRRGQRGFRDRVQVG